MRFEEMRRIAKFIKLRINCVSINRSFNYRIKKMKRKNTFV